MNHRFRTTRFGEIEFGDDVVLTLPDGILGFPSDRRYMLLEHDAAGSPFKWLQSLDNPDLAFIVVDPTIVNPRYGFELDVDLIRQIGTDDPEQCAVMCIVNVPHDHPIRMTANLKAPLVINVESRIGRQTILGSQAYAINMPVFPHLVRPEEEEDEAVTLQRGVAG
jgi:flagellar assembly factor FliW